MVQSFCFSSSCHWQALFATAISMPKICFILSLSFKRRTKLQFNHLNWGILWRQWLHAQEREEYAPIAETATQNFRVEHTDAPSLRTKLYFWPRTRPDRRPTRYLYLHIHWTLLQAGCRLGCTEALTFQSFAPHTSHVTSSPTPLLLCYNSSGLVFDKSALCLSCLAANQSKPLKLENFQMKYRSAVFFFFFVSYITDICSSGCVCNSFLYLPLGNPLGGEGHFPGFDQTGFGQTCA